MDRVDYKHKEWLEINENRVNEYIACPGIDASGSYYTTRSTSYGTPHSSDYSYYEDLFGLEAYQQIERQRKNL